MFGKLHKIKRVFKFKAIIHLVLAFFAIKANAENIRVGIWNTELSRKGPGLLMEEFMELEGEPDWAGPIRELNLDYLLLVDVDQDYEARVAKEIQHYLNYSYFYLGESNRGLPTGLDANNDNWFDEDDMQGFGQFHGQHSMVLLAEEKPKNARNFNTLKWKDFANNPSFNEQNYYSSEAWELLRLSPTGLWDTEFNDFRLLSAYASTPAFDGEEKRNVLRNASEIKWWTRYISGESFIDDDGIEARLEKPFILMGTLNLDPNKGKGDRETIKELLARPELKPVQFKNPNSVDWSRAGLGEMRVDYILPSCHFEQIQSGQLDLQTPHRLQWAELSLQTECETKTSKSVNIAK